MNSLKKQICFLFFSISLFLIGCATFTTASKSINAKDYPMGINLMIEVSNNVVLNDIPAIANKYSIQDIRTFVLDGVKTAINRKHGVVVDQFSPGCNNCYKIVEESVDLTTKMSTKNYTNKDKGYNNFSHPFYKTDLDAKVKIIKYETGVEISSKTFDAKSSSRLQTGNLPPYDQLDDINKYITLPKYDFKDLCDELNKRIAIWGSKELNDYLSK
jgi:hypothetical protein